MMRIIDVETLIPIIRELVIKTNYTLPNDVKKAIETGAKQEISSIGKQIFLMMQENTELASQKQLPLCQDTGVAVFFLRIGQDIKFTNGFLPDAIQEAVKQAYQEGYLRKSIVSDPLFKRKNTQNNLPAIIHQEFVQGEQFTISFMPKGGGAENMSRVKMLNPAAGIEGVKQFVLETVELARGNACPPLIVGVGIGATFDTVAMLAKKALLRPIGSLHEKQQYANLEKELLELLNQTGIGPQGLGGKMTALAVHIENHPCHIASMPAAVNLQCHVHRHTTIVL